MAEAAAARGSGAVTVADLTARAGVAPEVFHEHFEDLEACFLATFEWGVRLAGARMAAAYEQESRWLDGVRAALGALLKLLDERPDLARLCVVHSLGAGPRVLHSRARALATVGEYLDRARIASGPRADLPELTAEGVVGAVLAIIQTRLLAESPEPLRDLQGQLMSLILLPYLGPIAARKELKPPALRLAPAQPGGRSAVEGLGMRLTYRTARVLSAIAECPGSNNREIANRGGVVDQGQISKLLGRLEGLGLIANVGQGGQRGAPNAWVLTPRGEQVEYGIRNRSERHGPPAHNGSDRRGASGRRGASDQS